jgi:hypothetical protein
MLILCVRLPVKALPSFLFSLFSLSLPPLFTISPPPPSFSLARIVRRSFALHGYRNVTYGEGITLSALLDATLFMVQQVWSGQMPLRDLWPSPGAGPSPNMMVEGRGAIEFVAKNTESGNYVRTEVCV